MEPGIDPAFFVDLHLRALEFIELLADCSLVSRSELGPRLICSPVVVVRVGALDILMEAQDLPGLELSHCGSLGQLSREPPFDLASL